jgi:hypothetical protein
LNRRRITHTIKLAVKNLVLAIIGNVVIFNVYDTTGEQAASQLYTSVLLLCGIRERKRLIDRDVRRDAIKLDRLHGVNTRISRCEFNL